MKMRKQDQTFLNSVFCRIGLSVLCVLCGEIFFSFEFQVSRFANLSQAWRNASFAPSKTASGVCPAGEMTSRLRTGLPVGKVREK
jgi:hypothetical protein